MATFVVTGGAGFIGSHICESLVYDGHTVRVVDNLSSGSRENLAAIEGNYEFVEGDIRDYECLIQAFAGVDAVIHQAAMRSVKQSVENPLAVNDVNITGTLTVLMAARNENVKRVVFASSSSVYGGAVEGYSRENLPVHPKSPYALTKVAGEEYCRIFQELYGLETVSLRYFNVFGPRQHPHSPYAAVIPLFTAALATHQAPTIQWDGQQSRDFTYVSNVVDANIAAATKRELAYGEVYNIGNGAPHTVADLYARLSELIGTSLEPVYAPKRAGDVRRSLADITKARQYLGYQPQVGFEDGLQLYVAWYIAQTQPQHALTL